MTAKPDITPKMGSVRMGDKPTGEKSRTRRNLKGGTNQARVFQGSVKINF
jgi:hypothetical protein